MSDRPLLELDKLSTHYVTARGTRVVKAVDEVSLSMRAGETLGVVGESGSGKTTLALSIMRLLPTAARIVGGGLRFDGEDLLAKSPTEMRHIRGKRQRIVGAIAISCEPRVLIADEPTTSLDVTIQAQYLKLLRDLQREHGLALIFITHNLGIVARMCDSVAVMYAGRVIEAGPVRQIFNAPVHPYTQALIESIPRLGGRLARPTALDRHPPQP